MASRIIDETAITLCFGQIRDHHWDQMTRHGQDRFLERRWRAGVKLRELVARRRTAEVVPIRGTA